ncbi:MAG: hypothetical protein ACRC5M_04600 [Anaeroplasmataceae bacterium]
MELMNVTEMIDRADLKFNCTSNAFKSFMKTINEVIQTIIGCQKSALRRLDRDDKYRENCFDNSLIASLRYEAYNINCFWDMFGSSYLSIRSCVEGYNEKYHILMSKFFANKDVFMSTMAPFLFEREVDSYRINISDVFAPLCSLKQFTMDYSMLKFNSIKIENEGYKEFVEKCDSTLNDYLEVGKNIYALTEIELSKTISSIVDAFDIYSDDKVARAYLLNMKVIDFLLILINVSLYYTKEIVTDKIIDNYKKMNIVH